MRLLRLLSWRPLRRRPLRALLAIVAVAAGTAMAVSIFVVRTSVSTSVHDFGRQLAGPTELRVVGAIRRGGLLPDVAERVARTDGVGAAVPVVQGVVPLDWMEPGARPALDGFDHGRFRWREVLLLGIDCRAEALVGRFGCTDDMVADHGDQPLAVGPAIGEGARMRTVEGDIHLAKAPVADRLPGMSALGGGNFVVFPLPVAQRLLGRGDNLDAVYVRPAQGVDVDDLRHRLERVVGEQNGVLAADQGPPEVEMLLSNVLPLFTLIGLFGLAIGALLVYNTVTLSLEERRREIAVVGALGGARRMVAATVLGEAAVVGGIGGVLGAVGGRFVAAPIVRSVSGFTKSTAAIPIAVHAGPSTLVLGVAAGIGVAVAASLVPMRRALRAAVADELSNRGATDERAATNFGRRAVVFAGLTAVGLGLVLLSARGGGLDPWQPAVGSVGFALVAVSQLLVAGNAAPRLIRPLTWVVPDSPAGRLAVANLRRAPGRTAVMVVALSGAAATAFVTAGYGSGLQATVHRQITANMDGVAVSATDSGVTSNYDAVLPEKFVAQLAAMPEVADIRRGTTDIAGTEPGNLMSVSAWQDPWEIRDTGSKVVLGRIDRAAFDGGEAVVNTLLARAKGIRPGDRVALPTPSGMVRVPVQAVVEGGGIGTGRQVLIPWSLHQRLYGTRPVRSVNVRPRPGVSLDRLASKIEGRLQRQATAEEKAGSRLPTWYFVNTPASLIRAGEHNVRYTMLPFWALQRGLLMVSFVAVLSTLLLVGVQRRREMGMLAAVGMTPWRLAQMVLAEAAVVGVVAVGLGVLGGSVTLWALTRVGPLFFGFSNPFRPDWSSVVTSGGVAVIVALAAAAWPARRAARTEVIPALRYE